MERVDYRGLAHHLSVLPLIATVGEFIDRLAEYPNTGWLIGDLLALPDNNSWFDALDCVCQQLKAQNPRFMAGLFMEWCLESI